MHTNATCLAPAPPPKKQPKYCCSEFPPLYKYSLGEADVGADGVFVPALSGVEAACVALVTRRVLPRMTRIDGWRVHKHKLGYSRIQHFFEGEVGVFVVRKERGPHGRRASLGHFLSLRLKEFVAAEGCP